MLIIGRITKDAVVKQLESGKQVVNFSIAVNDWYKPKGSDEGLKLTTFINCSYWFNTRIAERLTKGSLVELYGRISTNVYTDAKGEAKASINLHVNSIKIHSTGGSNVSVDGNGKLQTTGAGVEITEPVSDLPF
jgi:single-strand DNA-binding protein